MSKGDDQFHFSPSGLPDAKDLAISSQRMRDDWKLVTGVDIGYCAGYNTDGTVVYIDRDVPEFADIKGRKVNIWQAVMNHEMLEKTILLRYGNEHYAGAHTIATFWENTCVKTLGIDPNAYEDWWKAIIAKVAARKSYPNTPNDLDLTPYEDEKDTKTLDRMTFVKVGK